MATGSARGGRFDMEGVRGEVIGPWRMSFRQDDGRPLDLQGLTVRAVAKTRGASPTARTVTCTVVGDGQSGEVDVSVGDAVTALAEARPPMAPPEVWDWLMDVDGPNEGPRPLLYGEIRVYGGAA